jgi:hypothetical protein
MQEPALPFRGDAEEGDTSALPSAGMEWAFEPESLYHGFQPALHI